MMDTTFNNPFDTFFKEETTMTDANQLKAFMKLNEMMNPHTIYLNKIRKLIEATYDAVEHDVIKLEEALPKLKEAVLFQIDEMFNPPE